MVLHPRNGFHQVTVAEENRPKTAFCIGGNGLWQFKVKPFGMTNSPATFKRLMERVFSGLTYMTLLIYLDDIIVFGKTFAVHLQNLEEVLIRLREANLKLSPEKCKFLRLQVSFLGFLVSERSLETDPAERKSVVEWPTPTNVREVRASVGLCSYLCKFIPNFSTTCKPLHVLTEKGQTFEWTDKCETAFNTLKTALISAPVLAFTLEFQGEFIVACDASYVAIGAVFSRIQDGEEKVIVYFSHCLSKAERAYCTTRKELLSFVNSIMHFITISMAAILLYVVIMGPYVKHSSADSLC